MLLSSALAALAMLACTGADKSDTAATAPTTDSAPDTTPDDTALEDTALEDTDVSQPDVTTEVFDVEDSASVPCASGDFERPTGYSIQNLQVDPFVVYAVLDDCSRIGDDLIKPGDTRSFLGYVGAVYVAVNQDSSVEVQYFVLGNDEPTITLEK